MRIPLKLKHGIHNMLQHLGAGNTPLLINMANKDHRYVGLLSHP